MRKELAKFGYITGKDAKRFQENMRIAETMVISPEAMERARLNYEKMKRILVKSGYEKL